MQKNNTTPGADELIAWFGSWPSFHDAEVLSIELHRSGSSSMSIHAWEMTADVDPKGFYVLRKHVVVVFSFEGISHLELEGFSSQNVIFGLELKQIDDGYELSMSPCYGVNGYIRAKQVRISFAPGRPADGH